MRSFTRHSEKDGNRTGPAGSEPARDPQPGNPPAAIGFFPRRHRAGGSDGLPRGSNGTSGRWKPRRRLDGGAIRRGGRQRGRSTAGSGREATGAGEHANLRDQHHRISAPIEGNRRGVPAGFRAPLGGHGSGISRVTLNPGHNEVCWEVTVAGLTAPAFAAHIHQGGADVNGPIVVPFFNTGFGTPSSATSFSGCTENVDRSLIEDIQDNPSGYYVNVHTSCAGQPASCGPFFPGSAVRGQLTHP